MSLVIAPCKTGVVSHAGEMAQKKLVARRSGHIHLHGNIFKKRHAWVRFCDFMNASRGPTVMNKAFYESKHYSQAAIIRKSYSANQLGEARGQPLTDDEFNEHVWNSNGVQNRFMREDYVRFNKSHYSKENGCTTRNGIARMFSRTAHFFHGLCEMNAAPTGMTTNLTRNLALGKVDDKGMKNKAFMLGSLGFIGVATTELIQWAKKAVPDKLTLLKQDAGGVLMAFSMLSATAGFLTTICGWTSQALISKQKLTKDQISEKSQDLNASLQKLLHLLLSVKGDADKVKMVGKAMTGKRWFMNKISTADRNADGVPVVLLKCLEAINTRDSTKNNMNGLFNALGEFTQVPDKPNKENASRWDRFSYTKKVKEKERNVVALLSLVEHMDISAADKKAGTVDCRKYLEDTAMPWLHKKVLMMSRPMFKVFDKVFNTHTARTIKHWCSKEGQMKAKLMRENPLWATKNCYHADYMVSHRHQYKGLTRGLITATEAMRQFNMNVVLSSNGNLSRIFNNLAFGVNEKCGTSPASRTLCNSIGRTLGGAVLTLFFGLAVPAIEAHTGRDGSYDLAKPDTKEPVTISFSNIGILMFLVALPTFVVQCAAQISARTQGWQGDIQDHLRSGDNSFTW